MKTTESEPTNSEGEPLAGIVGEGIRCYPNPTSETLTVEFGPSFRNEPVSLHLFDFAGREVLRAERAKPGKTDTSLKALPAGVYLMRVEQGGAGGMVKVVKL